MVPQPLLELGTVLQAVMHRLDVAHRDLGDVDENDKDGIALSEDFEDVKKEFLLVQKSFTRLSMNNPSRKEKLAVIWHVLGHACRRVHGVPWAWSGGRDWFV